MTYTQTELARLAGVSGPLFNYHILGGRIPAPTVQIGRRTYYDEAGKAAVLAYYVSYKPRGGGRRKIAAQTRGEVE